MATKKVGKLSYDPKTVIGRGGFGTVFKGFHHDSSHQDDIIESVAVKRLPLTDVEEDTIQREVELMKSINVHPNIIRYICTEINDDFLFIATELCSATLKEYVEEPCHGLRFDSDREILYELTQGLAYLHNLGIVHRDIKPNNILISVQTGSAINYWGTINPQIKLADFGLSKSLKVDKKDFTNSSVKDPSGTTGWLAPEAYESDRLDFKVDIWALGCIFGYTLSRGEHPFGDKITRINRIMKKEPMQLVLEDFNFYPQDVLIDKDCVNAFKLVESMLVVVPSNRPTIAEVEKSAYFTINSERTLRFLRNSFSWHSAEDTIPKFERLLKEDTLDAQANADGRTLLHFLCEKYVTNDKVFNVFQFLIKKGCNINAKDKNNSGNTPLHLLCLTPHHEYDERDSKNLVRLIELMMENGADVNSKSTFIGETPLQLLCRAHRNYEERNSKNLVQLIQLLIQNGADVNARVIDGLTPLQEVCASKEQNRGKLIFDIVQILIENGADINDSKAIDGWSPLHYLCCFHKTDNLLDIFQLLLKKGADINANSEHQNTPLHIFCQYYQNGNMIDLVRFLIKNGADVNAKDADGNTPLLSLLRKYDNVNLALDIVQLFEENGADIKTQNIINGGSIMDILYRKFWRTEDVIEWYWTKECPKGAGLDPETGLTSAWFHGAISFEEAKKRLSGHPRGTFLVRLSDGRILLYELIVKSDPRRFCNYTIASGTVWNEQKYSFYWQTLKDKEPTQNSLREFVHFYGINPLPKCYEDDEAERLLYPCPK